MSKMEDVFNKTCRIMEAGEALCVAAEGIMNQWRDGVDVSTYLDITELRNAITHYRETKR